jgi:hypothetical protein
MPSFVPGRRHRNRADPIVFQEQFGLPPARIHRRGAFADPVPVSGRNVVIEPEEVVWVILLLHRLQASQVRTKRIFDGLVPVFIQAGEVEVFATPVGRTLTTSILRESCLLCTASHDMETVDRGQSDVESDLCHT